jgi:hypothetical protein
MLNRRELISGSGLLAGTLGLGSVSTLTAKAATRLNAAAPPLQSFSLPVEP